MYRGKNKGDHQQEESDSKSNSSAKMQTTTKLVSAFVQLAVLSVAVLIIFRTIQDAGIILYTIHPTLMSIGYLVLMSQGILAMSGLSLYADGFKHSQRVAAHWVIQTVALVLIVVAQASIFINKNNNNYLHFQTIHSWCGLVTNVFTVFGTIGGVMNKYSSAVRNFVKPMQLKIGHGFAGCVIYILANTTICVGLNQVWMEEKDAQMKLASMVILFFSSFYIVLKSAKTAITRIIDN